jgi:hypothetical protein
VIENFLCICTMNEAPGPSLNALIKDRVYLKLLGPKIYSRV